MISNKLIASHLLTKFLQNCCVCSFAQTLSVVSCGGGYAFESHVLNMKLLSRRVILLPDCVGKA